MTYDLGRHRLLIASQLELSQIPHETQAICGWGFVFEPLLALKLDQRKTHS